MLQVSTVSSSLFQLSVHLSLFTAYGAARRAFTAYEAHIKSKKSLPAHMETSVHSTEKPMVVEILSDIQEREKDSTNTVMLTLLLSPRPEYKEVYDNLLKRYEHLESFVLRSQTESAQNVNSGENPHTFIAKHKEIEQMKENAQHMTMGSLGVVRSNL